MKLNVLVAMLCLACVTAALANDVEWTVTPTVWQPGELASITVATSACDSTVAACFRVIPPGALRLDHAVGLGYLTGGAVDTAWGDDPPLGYRFAVVLYTPPPWDYVYGFSGPFAEVWLRNTGQSVVRWCDGGVIDNAWIEDRFNVRVIECPTAVQPATWTAAKQMFR